MNKIVPMLIVSVMLAFSAMAAEGPQVTITFDGLETIFLGNPDYASIGILDVPHHTPRLTVTKSANGTRTTVVVLEGEDLKDSLFVEIDGLASQGIVRAVSLKQCIDLNALHGALTVNDDKLFGKIHFTIGEFHAGKLSDYPVRFFSVSTPGKMLRFNRRVAAPAARIQLVSGDNLVIRGSKTNLRLPVKTNISYEINITNLPKADMASMDHFLNYYQVFNEKVERFTPLFIVPSSMAPFPTACFATTASSSAPKVP